MSLLNVTKAFRLLLLFPVLNENEETSMTLQQSLIVCSCNIHYQIFLITDRGLKILCWSLLSKEKEKHYKTALQNTVLRKKGNKKTAE